MTSFGPGGGRLDGDSLFDYALLLALLGPPFLCVSTVMWSAVRWLWQNT